MVFTLTRREMLAADVPEPVEVAGEQETLLQCLLVTGACAHSEPLDGRVHVRVVGASA